MTPKKLGFLLVFSCLSLLAADQGGRAEYVGGTISQVPEGCEGRVQAIDSRYFVFYSRKASWRVPYERIDLLEYGQTVGRHYLAALFVSQIFLLTKKRAHFLTVGYQDEDGKQQAMVFRIYKGDIRVTLASLEARTGRKVEFQDEEARKAGRG